MRPSGSATTPATGDPPAPTFPPAGTPSPIPAPRRNPETPLTPMSPDERDLILNWLREVQTELDRKVDRLDRAVQRLEARAENAPPPPERPCPELQTHLEDHDQTKARWWQIALAFVRPIAAGIAGALFVFLFGDSPK